ncbi:acetyl/propionyl-CoA carboxylase subuit alpha [Cellulomonas sp. Root485]|uniref:acetyl/propionyl/methylcrotonyl-CoA carboxylase subunit alpha n=1 Tax=Cellulomonas sp. Root485 TaxID=1736546 RepID=UPI0006FF098E|nr:biotin carboxylase N-terminal domain-containing protein [Cellulomonas sp. Root485]KQY21257.1 acetyl/propionyl-CoA carboxylase subuit alpha [Cellulomonas sp. Root485]
MFRSVLVANRAEIACRVIATLQRLGIRAVAVYTDADRDALHVERADSAVRIDSYLSIEAVVAAARAVGADAIHPGYGFLSENADLARACEAAGVVFVGPGVKALEVMGDKIRAKEHVSAAGVPVIPGSSSIDAAAAERVGYPLLVKPSAGGGGKGMTVVERPEDLADALVGARRVAAAAFGDDTLLLERLVRSPRHIEVQLLADGFEHVIHLGERECSLQRRHQKVIEEAPSPLLDSVTRQRIGEAACDVARSVGYVGAGTVEFLVSDEAPTEFFFMEMNTRLQVEHPVTELVTGLDLVEWQLRVAAGEPLTVRQSDVVLTGHAIEARVYAEDPLRDFLPSAGTVHVLDEPTGDGIRVDSALQEGLEIGSAYDPMLAKVIAWGTDRATAMARLDAALARTTILGVRTNVEFLRGVLADPDVQAGRLDTGLLARLIPTMEHRTPSDVHRVAAALARHHARAGETGTSARERQFALPFSRRTAGLAWSSDGWRLGENRPVRYEDVSVLGDTVSVGDGEPVLARLTHRGSHAVDLELDGVVHPLRLVTHGSVTWVGDQGSAFELRFRTRVERLADELAAVTRGTRPVDPQVRSPMPGTVVSVEVESGDSVVAGQILLTIEAMKMEHRVVAPSDGIVHLTVRPTDQVALDHVVATITGHPDEGTPA